MFHPNNCWLNIYKPKGISSAKLVSIIKKNLLGAKVGHCGTLDIEAEGVLVLAVGEATKLVRILINVKKTYIFTVQFGKKTNTADASGTIISITDHIPTSNDCHNIHKKFIGLIEQRPPAFSAIKVNGIRSYKLARDNLPVELACRKIEIYNLECLNFNHQNNQATYKVECSKGTYIRTLAEDIALSLQTYGFVVELRRIKVGIFTADNALKLTKLNLQKQEIMAFLTEKSIKIEAVLDDILVLNANDNQAEKIMHGQKCYFDYPKKSVELIWIRYRSSLLAIGSINKNCFNSFRVFNL